MFQPILKKSLRKTIVKISDTFNLDKTDMLKVYLNETATNMNLTKYEYQNYTLLKDCFNNLYIVNNNKLELMGYINNNNDIIFDEIIKKKLVVPEIKTTVELSITADQPNQKINIT